MFSNGDLDPNVVGVIEKRQGAEPFGGVYTHFVGC